MNSPHSPPSAIPSLVHDVTEQRQTQAQIERSADRLRLRQVLLNLLSNAIKYNRDAGRVGVRSVPGAGSTFWVELPAALEATAEPPALGAHPNGTLKGTLKIREEQT